MTPSVQLAQLLATTTTFWTVATVVALVLLGLFQLVAALKVRRLRSIPFRDTAESDIFLSYKSEDARLVRFLGEQMMARGHNVWFNEYRVFLRGWEGFEEPLRNGVAFAKRAVFFTNAKWAASKYAVGEEARPLLARLKPGACPQNSAGTRPKGHPTSPPQDYLKGCVEVAIPPEATPHVVVPGLKHVPYIDGNGKDRWILLKELCAAFNFPCDIEPGREDGSRPLRGYVNNVPYELNFSGWRRHSDPVPSMGNAILTYLTRADGGTFMSVNLIAGKRGEERTEISSFDDRKVFDNLRTLAEDYFQGTPLAGACAGVHLVLQSDLSHAAFTYWGRNAWCRKYAIVLPAQDGGADIEFTFTCSVYGPFTEFCRVAWRFDDLVASLQYGKWSSP